MTVRRITGTSNASRFYYANDGQRQDVERIIQEDDDYFQKTGINRLTPSNSPSPFVEDDPEDLIAPAVMEAYQRREEIVEKRKREAKAKEYEDLAKQNKNNGLFDFFTIPD